MKTIIKTIYLAGVGISLACYAVFKLSALSRRQTGAIPTKTPPKVRMPF